ncbi:MAG: porin [Proteobacteria bacterium]|nr:porin [Pseudomonadota bacterium]
MKKLLTFVSAITAGAIGTASAEVSVSGSSNFFYAAGSGDANSTTQEDYMSVVGGTLAFAMSTETTNGITVSGSASVSAATTDVTTGAGAAPANGGLSQINFGMDGMTVTLGDINNAGSGTGEGGIVTSFAHVNAARLTTVSAAAANDSAMDGIADGTGINLSTSIGAASVDVTFVTKVGSGRNSLATTAKTTGYNSGYAVNVGFDFAGAAVNVAGGGSQAQVAGVKNDSAFAIEASYPVSDALSVTFGASDGTISGAEEDNMFLTAAYTMDADTTLSVGYAKGDNTASSVLDKATISSVNISRSLGGGVSVFAEYAAGDYDNAAVATSGTSLAVGTKIAF